MLDPGGFLFCLPEGTRRRLQMWGRAPLSIFSPWDFFELADTDCVRRITYVLVSLLISVLGYVSKWTLCHQVFILSGGGSGEGEKIQLCCFARQRRTQWAHTFKNCYVPQVFILCDVSAAFDIAGYSFFLDTLFFFFSFLPSPHPGFLLAPVSFPL